MTLPLLLLAASWGAFLIINLIYFLILDFRSFCCHFTAIWLFRKPACRPVGAPVGGQWSARRSIAAFIYFHFFISDGAQVSLRPRRVVPLRAALSSCLPKRRLCRPRRCRRDPYIPCHHANCASWFDHAISRARERLQARWT